jgi:lantibiotic modifying enzyme
VDSAVREDRDVGWIGLRLMDDRHWILSGTEFDLYSGTSGIAIGLDAVAAVTGDPVVDEVALTVFDQIGRLIRLQDAEKLRDGITPTSALDIGAMGPLAGVVYALATASNRRCDPAIAAPAELLLPVLTAAIADDGFFDVVAGAAGTLLALLALEEARPGCGALDVATLAGRHLVESQLPGPGGGGWRSKLSSAPLAGLSHGASGIALALARLHAVRPDPAQLTAIGSAVRYERSLFDPAVRNWRDVRELNEKQDAGMVTWCHGAGGIAAVRASLLRLGVPDPGGVLENDRSAAVRTIAEAGLFTDGRRGIGNHSLCHGDLGNLLMLEQALTGQDEAAFADAVPATWAAILRDAGAHGWLAGVPTGVEVPGLMCGTAGMAWALARKAAPTKIADVLTLAARPAVV